MEDIPAAELNVADTDVSAFKVTLHFVVPLHAPDHPENAALGEAAAVSVTTVPAENVALQVDPQSMPEGLLVIVPDPEPEVATVN